MRFLILYLLLAGIPAMAWPAEGNADGAIKVGVLHSLSGTMAISEQAVVDATLLALEEINAGGGLLGRRVEPLVRDGASDWGKFAEEAERLVVRDRVAVVFGCWTSASRKTVRSVFEKHGHLLIYPVQYEGLEQSPNIVYTGAAPNQQIIPAVKWGLDHLGNRFYLVGSDYVFPRSANEIIKRQVQSLKGSIVGERYLPLGSGDVDEIVADIARTRPDAILNTINGDSNLAFFRELRRAGITPRVIPTVSFSIGESELANLSARDLAGDYAVWNYFQSLDSPANRRFVAAFRSRYGQGRVVSDPMEAAYFGVQLWAQAVRRTGSADVDVVRNAMPGRMVDAPEGLVYIDPKTRHTWKNVRVGRIRADGQFDVVWSTQKPVRPIPYPIYLPQRAWEGFLDGLKAGWGGQWARPAEARP